MTNEMADEIFKLSIEAQRIENRQWEIRKELKKESGSIPGWSEVSTEAMKFKMEQANG